ncbi:MAG: 4-(cytidine 5'-diphospho)-2-C-methyl-D-erythritol kinase [candidate division Zixibacteria bacterium]|nr:4-(cytidine 5'-diphospho)-2-C-methyl-D-erythritol kinase [candidate division Zixibacteria bacterium]
MESLTLKSYAKINLCLYVLKEREDGYHEIFSVMQAIDLHDRLTLHKIQKEIVIRCDHPDVPKDENNLAYQAADLLFKERNLKGGVKIDIEKQIPVSAGLGGGSSNAAFTLKGINQLFDLKLSNQKLHLIGSRIGSDVPFFLYSGQAMAKGRGEKIVPIRLYRDYWLVLVCPNLMISTKTVYQNVKIDLTAGKSFINLNCCDNKDGFFNSLRQFNNDLEKVVINRHRIISHIKKTLENSGAIKSSMSGSGPAVYGLFEKKPQAEEVARKLTRGDWQIFLTRPIAFSS